MPKVDEERLAVALAERLNRLLPTGMRIEAVGSTLTTYGLDGKYAIYNATDLLPTPLDEGYEYYVSDPWPSVKYWVYTVLDGVQDDVAHATRGVAWPPSSSPAQPLLMAWAEVRGRALHMGYGNTALVPVVIDEILSTHQE
jgi:hypothetical protein